MDKDERGRVSSWRCELFKTELGLSERQEPVLSNRVTLSAAVPLADHSPMHFGTSFVSCSHNPS